MNVFIRQFHRWVSAAFVVAVIATTIALAQKEPVMWMSYVPLIPLALLAITGIYMFFLPTPPGGVAVGQDRRAVMAMRPGKAMKKAGPARKAMARPKPSGAGKPKLLSGGNPQIAQGPWRGAHQSLYRRDARLEKAKPVAGSIRSSRAPSRAC